MICGVCDIDVDAVSDAVTDDVSDGDDVVDNVMVADGEGGIYIPQQGWRRELHILSFTPPVPYVFTSAQSSLLELLGSPDDHMLVPVLRTNVVDDPSDHAHPVVCDDPASLATSLNPIQ